MHPNTQIHAHLVINRECTFGIHLIGFTSRSMVFELVLNIQYGTLIPNINTLFFSLFYWIFFLSFVLFRAHRHKRNILVEFIFDVRENLRIGFSVSENGGR